MKRKTSRPPAAHRQFVRRFPTLGQAWDLVNVEGARGPLDAKTQRLLKLGIAIGAMREGAVHSGVRKARDAGASVAEMEQVVALAASTIGLPASVAVWSWVREEVRRGRPTSRRRRQRPGDGLRGAAPTRRPARRRRAGRSSSPESATSFEAEGGGGGARGGGRDASPRWVPGRSLVDAMTDRHHRPRPDGRQPEDDRGVLGA